MERFVPKNGVPKNGFPIVFSKSDLGGGGHIFRRNFFLKKPNTPEYAQVLVVTCPKLNSVTALLSPHPTFATLGLLKDIKSIGRFYIESLFSISYLQEILNLSMCADSSTDTKKIPNLKQFNFIFTESALRPNQSTSHNVRLCVCVCVFVCLFVPSRNSLFWRLWRLLVELRPPNIALR